MALLERGVDGSIYSSQRIARMPPVRGKGMTPAWLPGTDAVPV